MQGIHVIQGMHVSYILQYLSMFSEDLISRQACIMHFTVYGHVFRGPDLDHYDHTYRTPVPTPPAAVPVAPAPIAPRTARRVLPIPPSEEGEEEHPRYSCTVGFSVLL